MTKSITVVSKLVDSSVRELQPDTEYKLFDNLTQLELHLSTKPIRCDKLVFTKDVLGTTINLSLSTLVTILESKFFATTELVYITDYAYTEKAAIEHMQSLIPIEIQVVRRSLTRDFITSYLTGNIQEDDVSPDKLARIRVKRSEYIRKRVADMDNLNLAYTSDDEALEGLPSAEAPQLDNVTHEGSAKLINICGLRSLERTAFTFMLGQYLSIRGKTVLIESDFKYLTLSDMVVRSGVEALLVHIEDWYNKPQEIIPLIRNTSKRLICIVSTTGKKFDYNFIQQLVYANLSDSIDYMVLEYGLDYTNAMQEYIVVTPNNIVRMIETLNKLKIRVSSKTKFACIGMLSIEELAVTDRYVIANLIQEILQLENMPLDISIYTLTSLKFGGKAYDLQTYIPD